MKNMILDSIIFQFYRIQKAYQAKYKVGVFYMSEEIGWNQQSTDVGISIIFFLNLITA